MTARLAHAQSIRPRLDFNYENYKLNPIGAGRCGTYAALCRGFDDECLDRSSRTPPTADPSQSDCHAISDSIAPRCAKRLATLGYFGSYFFGAPRVVGAMLVLDLGLTRSIIRGPFYGWTLIASYTSRFSHIVTVRKLM
jgi:hypothetical protein